MAKHVSGTNEWSVATVNLPQTGCEHDCRYCYAAFNACERFKYAKRKDWSRPAQRLLKSESKYRRLYPGTVMTPSNHDITPANVVPFIRMLQMLLDAGNSVLVVTKPHRECVERICREITSTSRVTFRFTIGAMDDKLLSYWEPGAPKFTERFESLRLAYWSGYQTSVSCEPNLCGVKVVDLFHRLAHVVSQTIWIGKMNQPEQRVHVHTDKDRAMLKEVVDGQADERVLEVYESLKDHPIVRWKESYKKVIGLPLQTESGKDR